MPTTWILEELKYCWTEEAILWNMASILRIFSTKKLLTASCRTLKSNIHKYCCCLFDGCWVAGSPTHVTVSPLPNFTNYQVSITACYTHLLQVDALLPAVCKSTFIYGGLHHAAELCSQINTMAATLSNMALLLNIRTVVFHTFYTTTIDVAMVNSDVILDVISCTSHTRRSQYTINA